MPSDGDGITA